MKFLKKIVQKLISDKYYLLTGALLTGLLLAIWFRRASFIAAVSIPIYDLHILGNTYSLDLFDGILFGLFITLTIATAWYFGGHAAFMFTTISWNFEIALFIILTGRVELLVEFGNLIVFAALYTLESPADRRRRMQTQTIESTNEELQQLTLSYSRFVPLEFLKLLGKESITEVKLGETVQRRISIMFADIRSFVSIAEKLQPQALFEFLNEFLKEVGPLIRKHNGFIDKYLGDGVMALFPVEPEDAVRCAIELQEVVANFNARMKEKGLPEIQTGAGIHCGTSMLGTIGDEYRMDSTVIADAVNLSSRLESLTKTYGARIVVSQQMLDAVKSTKFFSYRFLDRTQLKGRSEEINIYEIFKTIPDNNQHLNPEYIRLFESAAIKYHEGTLWDAYTLFRQLALNMRHDKALDYYLERCQREIKLQKS